MTGKQLAHYEITGKLGAGGMGVVYEAIDRRLGRRVALKILAADKVADSARKQRFIQEAKAASALNHPNIVTIYDIGAADGVDYIAMELAPGRTIEDMLAKRRLQLPEALRIAAQIADAMAAAHAAGIVHRDIKPANIMVSETGLVKVLDFGLAKLTDESGLSDEDATRTERAMTEEGTVLGSAPYMSPEQAEGKKVDARSDIFSFGLVLYEMLSGRRAFRAGTRMSTIAAILNKEPEPLGEIVPGLPIELERLVTRCLRKDLSRRSQSMPEIRIALQELKEETESGASARAIKAKRTPTSRRRWMALGGAALAVSALAFFLLKGLRETEPPLKEVPLTSYPGYQGEPALSPDGSQFAFTWDGGHEQELPQLYISLMGHGAPLKLTNTPGAWAGEPAWSPDGQTIAFILNAAGQRPSLMVIPALGGPARRIDEGSGRPAWSPDGKWLYFRGRNSPQTSAIFVEPSSGGDKRQVTEPPAGSLADRDPAVSPDGRKLVFVRSFADFNHDLFVTDLQNGRATGVARRITNDRNLKFSPMWTVSGKDVVYVSVTAGSDLEALYRLRASGGPPVRLEGIGANAVELTIAPKGHRLVYSRAFQDINMWRMPLSTADGSSRRPNKFLSSTRAEYAPAYSPDGKRITFASDRGGLFQIWIADSDGSNPAPLTNFSVGLAGAPRWSPDSKTIVFDARPDGLADIYSINADGGTPKRLTDNPAEDHVPCYSADGRWIYFSSRRNGQQQIYRIPSAGGEAVQITRGGASVPVASADGKWIYYSKVRDGFWRVPVEGGAETRIIDPQNVNTDSFLFCVTAVGIYFAGPGDLSTPLRLYRFADGKIAEVGRSDGSLGLYFSVSPDEKWLLYSQIDSSVYDLRVVENFQ